MPLNLTAPGDPAQVAWTTRALMRLFATGATATPAPITWTPHRSFAPTALTATRAYTPPPHEPERGTTTP